MEMVLDDCMGRGSTSAIGYSVSVEAIGEKSSVREVDVNKRLRNRKRVTRSRPSLARVSPYPQAAASRQAGAYVFDVVYNVMLAMTGCWWADLMYCGKTLLVEAQLDKVWPRAPSKNCSMHQT